jgi:HEAT repeat protein
MNRRILLIVGMVVVFAAVFVVMQPEDEPPEPDIVTAEGATALRAEITAPAAPDPASAASMAPGTSVAELAAYASGGDAAKRAAAITALGNAPREEAIPVLGRILTDGEPEVDRPLALRALRDLALNQGDADGKIRDAVRNAIYHGDDFTKADEVQEALDTIEESQKGQ